MSPILSEYYPPLELDCLEDLLGMNKSTVLNLVANDEIKTKKMGNKIFVSNYSLNSFMDKVPKNRKEIAKRVVRRHINELKEDKILTYANLIQKMRKSNKGFSKLLHSKIKVQFSENISFKLNSRINSDNEIENISLDIPYSKIKSIILKVRDIDLWIFKK